MSRRWTESQGISTYTKGFKSETTQNSKTNKLEKQQKREQEAKVRFRQSINVNVLADMLDCGRAGRCPAGENIESNRA